MAEVLRIHDSTSQYSITALNPTLNIIHSKEHQIMKSSKRETKIDALEW